jgi:hypothetical protein
MRAYRLLTVTAAAVATAVAAFATVPSASADPIVVRHHGPIRVTVHKRSYLRPPTATGIYTESSSDYFRSPINGFDPMRNSALFTNGASLPFVHDRMPFPNCLDLPNFCR